MREKDYRTLRERLNKLDELDNTIRVCREERLVVVADLDILIGEGGHSAKPGPRKKRGAMVSAKKKQGAKRVEVTFGADVLEYINKHPDRAFSLSDLHGQFPDRTRKALKDHIMWLVGSDKLERTKGRHGVPDSTTYASKVEAEAALVTVSRQAKAAVTMKRKKEHELPPIVVEVLYQQDKPITMTRLLQAAHTSNLKSVEKLLRKMKKNGDAEQAYYENGIGIKFLGWQLTKEGRKNSRSGAYSNGTTEQPTVEATN